MLLITLICTPAEAACTVSTTGIAFGNYSPIDITPVDSQGIITITCNTNERTTTAIGPSPNSGGFNPRKMKQTGGSELLNYNLYTDASRSTIWGDGTGGTRTVTQRVNRTTVNLTVYGRIPAGQDVSVGQYSDILVITVNY
ncbi:MAG: spore coat U domain-containing protein [Syntrophales bacterium]|nr:spore coat U domain-containing protein [Syntrophales bacterium]